MEASSAGGEIWERGSKELKRPLLCSQIWDDRLADGRTDKSEIGHHRKFLSLRARAYFTLAVNL